MNTSEPITFLRLYVNPEWRRQGIHSPLMNPFWGNPYGDHSLHTKEYYDRYQYDTSLYGITDDIRSADMVFPPYRQQWLARHDEALWEECVQTAAAAGLTLLVDGTSDIEPPLNLPNVYVLRIGGYRFMPEPGAIHVPTHGSDLLESGTNKELTVREKGDRPVVAFAGWAELQFKQAVRSLFKELPIRLRGLADVRYRTMQKGVFWRQRAIRILHRSPLITCNFLLRTSFSGSTKTATKSLRELQQEMIDNLRESDYGLDVRGDPNTSNRLFEILSMGRIPVVIDTERFFPFSDEVDYDSFCLRVNYRDINKLPQILSEFHHKLSPEQFKEMQKNARKAYVDHFRVDAQMKHILRELSVIRAKS